MTLALSLALSQYQTSTSASTDHGEHRPRPPVLRGEGLRDRTVRGGCRGDRLRDPDARGGCVTGILRDDRGPEQDGEHNKEDHGPAASIATSTLAPETRVIWSYTLAETVNIPKHHPLIPFPPISMVSRQILDEVLPIYIFKTKFRFAIDNCDVALTRKSVARLEEDAALVGANIRSPRVCFHADFGGKGTWPNLFAWAQSVHAGRWSCFCNTDGPDQSLHVISSTLAIAVKLRKLPWEEAKAVLESLPAAKDPDWA